jgi:hypothetical protein
LSADSIVELTKHHPSPHFVVPLGLAAWFAETGVPASRVQEMDWWDETLFLAGASSATTTAGGGLSGPAAEGALRIACTPCQHGSGRAGWDKGSSLWASWCIGLVGGNKRAGSDSASDDASSSEGADVAKQEWENMRYKVFFAGDTAYRQFERKDSKYTCPAFKGASVRALIRWLANLELTRPVPSLARRLQRSPRRFRPRSTCCCCRSPRARRCPTSPRWCPIPSPAWQSTSQTRSSTSAS